MAIFNLEKRPGGFGFKFDEIDGFFTSNYIFATGFVAGKTVLDWGCGYGYGASYLARSGAKRVMGVDVDRNIIKSCAKCYENVENLEFIFNDSVKLDFDDETFDIIVSFEVIEHVEDYRNYLSEIRRMLKRDGMLILSTPNKNIYSPNLEKPIITNHVKEFYPAELFEELNKCFAKVEMYGKHIIDPELIKEQRKYEASIQYSITRNLSKVDFIRKMSRLIPFSIRRIVTGSKSHHIRPEDCLISKDGIETARSLVAVCMKISNT